MTGLALAHGLSFEQLYTRAGCLELDRLFLEALKARDTDLFNRLMAGRAAPDTLATKDESELLLALAPPLEDFLAELFSIEPELATLEAEHEALAPLYICKRLFVQRDSARAHSEAEAAAFDGDAMRQELDSLLGAGWDELAFATRVMQWREAESQYGRELDLARRYAAWAVYSAVGRERHRAGVLFKVPHKLDPLHLVPVETETRDGIEIMRVDLHHAPRREGFDLTDRGASLTLGLDDANYCIWCHNQGKDSCSKGLREKQGPDGRHAFRRSVFGVTLAGCPLEERISEMHALKASGHPLGALAMICVDNPLCAATGHRVCNDCMNACVYQKQEPVNIPRSESRILKDAIELPWGFEIYALLGRWNPLDLRRPAPRPESGKRVLVVGMGPAGFNLAHHLLNEGHTVVGVDALKIEPLPYTLSGIDERGARTPFRAIRDVGLLHERLDTRIMGGFGGLSEYGITVRWDKNYLKLIRLMLERRAGFRMYGSVRFGGTFGIDEAWRLGFDHIALCVGAGKPTVLDVPNGLARGVRIANDFLMALQVGGACKTDSVADLELRLPVVVIGGGLTAGDTATESLAYYPVQVERFLGRYEALAATQGDAALRAGWSEEERATADEFIAHGRAIRAERATAARAGRPARIRELVDSWGGVTIAYRRRLIDSPSYTLNHEEVAFALEEGVRFVECVAPHAVEVDRFGHAEALVMGRTSVGADGKLAETGESVTLPARSILVAAGTQPNVSLALEEPSHLKLDGRYFQALDESGAPVKPERVSKPAVAQLLVALEKDGRAISAYGDLHASFAGNVVKAMASAKRGYPIVSRLLEKRPTPKDTAAEFFASLDRSLCTRLVSSASLAPGLVEFVIEAPAAARAWRPGQFFRFQNFEVLAPQSERASLAMEGIAAMPSAVDAARGTISLVLATEGGSRAIATLLKPGEPVAFMGPDGTALALPERGTVLLAGEGFGVAALVPIAQALRGRGVRTLVFAGYASSDARFKQSEIERAADVAVWCAVAGPTIRPGRDGDKSFAGSVADGIVAYGKGALGAASIPLGTVERVFVFGPTPLAHGLAETRGPELAGLLKTGTPLVGSLLAPMQCMAKEICGRCLAAVRDPETGATRLVFACVDHHFPLDLVDLETLDERGAENATSERVTRAWVAHCIGASAEGDD
jgi:NADPH-dependent glutamate synthase beta subunit-like oxidoreductase/NAD(P)H-flavin reductase